MYRGTSFSGRDRIEYYTDAVNYLESVQPWRGETGPGDERPLKHRRHRNTGVRRRHDGAIVFRLHSTEVVTYLPSGEIVLRVYNSVTTADFINRLTPAYVLSSLPGSVEGFLRVRNRYYRASHGDVITIAPDLTVTGADPWTRRVVNRSRAAAVRKQYRIPEIRAYVQAALQLMRREDQPTMPEDMHCVVNPYGRWTLDAMADFANNPALWAQLVARPDPLHHIDRMANYLTRERALDDAEPQPWLGSHAQINAWRRAQKWS